MRHATRGTQPFTRLLIKVILVWSRYCCGRTTKRPRQMVRRRPASTSIESTRNAWMRLLSTWRSGTTSTRLRCGWSRPRPTRLSKWTASRTHSIWLARILIRFCSISWKSLRSNIWDFEWKRRTPKIDRRELFIGLTKIKICFLFLIYLWILFIYIAWL